MDILDPDVNLGWTQRLSAGIQLVTGEGGEAVASYIEQKEALNDIDDATGSYLDTLESSIGASNRHRGAIEDTGDAAEDTTGDIKAYETSVEALKSAEERQRTATDNARQAILNKRNALKEVHDPLFAMVELNEDLAEAEEAVDDATKPDEFRQAVLDRARILADLERTYIELRTQGIDPTGAAAQKMLEGLDIPPDVIAEIFRQFDELERNFESRTFRAQVSFPTWDVSGSGVGVQTGTRVFRQHGGPVRAGMPYIVGEAGPEWFIPNQSGNVLPNGRGPGGGAGGSTIINVGTVYGWDDFVAKVRDAGVTIERYGW
jgi:hypothetical protein